MIVKCNNCKKLVDSTRINTLLSFSESGFSTAVYLCNRCAMAPDIVDRYCNVNDRILNQLEGKKP